MREGAGDAAASAAQVKNTCVHLLSHEKLNSLLHKDLGIHARNKNVRICDDGQTVKFPCAGNMRSDEQGYMRGGDVFNFVIREIPRDIKNTLAYTEKTVDDFDYVVFHQANNFINSYIAKKMKLDSNKIPSTIAKFGNTSSVSVPLTIVSELQGKLDGKKEVLLSAFGVGMTWATGVLSFVDCKISDIVEVENGQAV